MRSMRSSRVVLPEAVAPARLSIEDGVIVSIDDGPADDDFGDLVILPGLIDSHVHVNEPGRTDWEGFETATRAAAAGGTTTIVDMPLNSIPPTVSVEALQIKRSAAAAKLNVDVAFWGGLVPGSVEDIPALVATGVCGFKSFLVESGVDEFPPVGLSELRQGLIEMQRLGVPSLLHAEDPASLLPLTGNRRSYLSYLDTRPEEGESRAVSVAAGLASETGARVHILHVSSPDAAGLLREHHGLSGETCPHYLTFCAEEIPDGATAFKCAPPIRTAEHREGLWESLSVGDLSMVVSDHSPAPPAVKALDSGDFQAAWGGVGSLQLRLAATWTGAHQRGIEISSLAAWLSLEPARLANLDRVKGSIEAGKDADLVVFDPDGATEVVGSELEHRHSITPYEGMTLRGRVVETVLGGRIVYDDGHVRPHLGRMLSPQ